MVSIHFEILYFELQKQEATQEQTASCIKELSELLHKRAISLNYDISASFRNFTGVTMKMANIQFIATDGEKGLSSVSKSDIDIVNKYMQTSERMHLKAVTIRQKYESNNDSREEKRSLLDDECPLVSELKKLKKSSSEAIDSEESFSEFKKYMHIHRGLEDDLIQKIEQAKSSNGKKLVLVCGNVGYGKSHIISYLKNTKGALLDGFTIHNDATESKSRNRDEKEEISKVLNNFKDKNLDNDSNDKIIVAINLGVLSNFIDSEQGKECTKLAEYVNKNKILIDTDISDYSDDIGYFSHVNFGDYHIYRLVDGNVDSPCISEVINRIFSNNSDNTFYARYDECRRCMVKGCPVKHNFEMMQQQNVVNGIINILIETIIKDKIILSTRELLDFFMI